MAGISATGISNVSNAKGPKGSATERNWDRHIDSNQATFTIMSYNLLANSLVWANPHLYKTCNPNALKWQNRSRTLLAELEKLESHELDFYCFQEIDSVDYERKFKNKFKSWGFSGTFLKRSGSKLDGCALFYRDKTVKAVSLIPVSYNENRFINRDNVGLVGLFDVSQGAKSRRVCIATTHILFNPRSGMLKIAQLRMLLEKARSLINEQEKDVPIVVLTESVNVSSVQERYLSGQTAGIPEQGYYSNSIPEFHEAFGDGDDSAQTGKSDSTTSIFLTETLQVLSSAGPSRSVESNQMSISTSTTSVAGRNTNPIISQPFVLESAYDINATARRQVESTSRPNWTMLGEPFTTFHGHARIVCDFIFYGHLRSAAESATLNKLQLVGCLELPCKMVEHGRGLPNRNFGSDHLSLVSKFRFVDSSSEDTQNPM
ncbi:Protein angel 2 [Mortierella sp. AD094]|nr:Protein angel 2 [Mortierella sp. AD094]